MNLDAQENIWFYHEHSLVHIRAELTEDTAYPVGIKWSNGVLFSSNPAQMLFETGFDNRFPEFGSPDVSDTEMPSVRRNSAENRFVVKARIGNTFAGEECCQFVYGNEPILFSDFTFRKTKAVFWNTRMLYFFNWR